MVEHSIGIQKAGFLTRVPSKTDHHPRSADNNDFFPDDNYYMFLKLQNYHDQNDKKVKIRDFRPD